MENTSQNAVIETENINTLAHKRSFLVHYDEMSVIMELDNEAAGTLLKCMIAHAVRETGMTAREDLTQTDEELQALIDEMKRTDKVLDVLFRQFIYNYREDTLRYSRKVKKVIKTALKNGGKTRVSKTTKKTPEKNLCNELENNEIQHAHDLSKTTFENDIHSVEAKVLAEVSAEGVAEVSAEDPAEEITEAPDGACDALTRQDINIPKIDYQQIMSDFNNCFSGILPKVKTMSARRKRAVRARLREFGRESLQEVMEKVSRSPFLQGQGERGWKASFDWILKPANYEKIAEGNYDETHRRHAVPPRYESALERERRLNEGVKTQIFNKAMGHILGVEIAPSLNAEGCV